MFTKATEWLRANDGKVGVLDVSWKVLPDEDEHIDLAIYFYPE